MSLTRTEKILAHLEGSGTILEIGPLASPVLKKPVHEVLYADHVGRQGLVEKYRNDPTVDSDRIPEIDVIWDGQGPFPRQDVRLVYAVASHVLEHVPNPIAWMRTVASLLRRGGCLSLALPDMRFTFDIHRSQSNVGELLDADRENRTRPSLRQIWDHAALYSEVDLARIWEAFPECPANGIEPDIARGNELVSRALHGEYVDVHCWVFTQERFLRLMCDLASMGYSDFYIEEFFPVVHGTNEFIVILRKKLEQWDTETFKQRIEYGLEKAYLKLR